MIQFLLDDGPEGGPGGVIQPDNVLGVGEDLSPVGLVNLLFDLFLDTGLEFVTAKEINSDEEVEQVRE